MTEDGCATCLRRHKEQWELLQTVLCDLLEGLVCPDCGESYSLFIEQQRSINEPVHPAPEGH